MKDISGVEYSPSVFFAMFLFLLICNPLSVFARESSSVFTAVPPYKTSIGDANQFADLPAARLGGVSRIDSVADISVRVGAFLDERLASEARQGHLRISVMNLNESKSNHYLT